ncbi:phospholipase D/nuclease [Nemania diffusa]|nr:phospholipase D/nuclease [Nemania diffusa]
MAYPNGAIRMTRTAGRKHTRNCISLPDIIHKDELESACIMSSHIAEEELYKHLPFSHTYDEIPIFIGRDITLDPQLEEAVDTGRADLEGLLQQLHSQKYGQNLKTFYLPHNPHPQVLLLEYSTFLRIVITSCNMRNIDTKQADNLWYIHDIPRRNENSREPLSTFGSELREFLRYLNVPRLFLQSIFNNYDYSTVNVHLTISMPSSITNKPANCGLMSMRRNVERMGLNLSQKDRSGALQLEVCSVKVGKLNAVWLNHFYDCALGKSIMDTGLRRNVLPRIKLFHPNRGDVITANKDAQDVAKCITCGVQRRFWFTGKEDRTMKNVFHHYISKDTGTLSHQNVILAYNPRATTQLPYYMYIGSATFETTSWGELRRINPGILQVVGMQTIECGVLIPGHLIDGLLEKGTGSWQEGIVPHIQTTPSYAAKNGDPWTAK